jgi:hypothetical protein
MVETDLINSGLIVKDRPLKITTAKLAIHKGVWNIGGQSDCGTGAFFKFSERKKTNKISKKKQEDQAYGVSRRNCVG